MVVFTPILGEMIQVEEHMPTKPRQKKKFKVGLAPPEPVLVINSSDKGDCPALEMAVKIYTWVF